MQLLEGRGESFLLLFSDVFQGVLKGRVCLKSPFLLKMKINCSKLWVKIFKYEPKAKNCVVTQLKLIRAGWREMCFSMAVMEWMRRGMEISYFVLPTASDWVYLNDAKATLSSVLLPCSDAGAEPESLYYKNNHKCYSTLFLNQCTYGNEDPDWALGSSQ